MPSIGLEQPPLDTDLDLSAYIVRMFEKVDVALQKGESHTPIFDLPLKPKNGDIRYFGAIVLPDVTAVGFWGYEEGTWTKL